MLRRERCLSRLYPHPVPRVWWALTDPVAMAAWIGPTDFEPSVGRSFVQRFYGRDVRGEVLEVEVEKRLSYLWDLGSVRFTWAFSLQPVASWTRLRVEQRGFEGLPALAFSYFLWSRDEPLFDRRLPAHLFRAMLDASADQKWRDRFDTASSPRPD